MANVLKAGSATNSTVTTNTHSDAIIVMPSGGAATIKLNNQTITLPAAQVSWVTIPGDYDTFTVTGTVLYILVG